MKIRRSFIKISAAFMAAAIALTLCGCQKTCADSFIPEENTVISGEAGAKLENICELKAKEAGIQIL